ncbi:ATP-dependent RNA helicase DBP10 [Lindgomyces ingoldianus]|uniref:ATP-dependent RNA helicase DBP10 n=1 Tax=Lindgomyces ingoldianus TaxID=673940 RepID=A0ACB6QYM0_9PLEO|nr:ATP-dependent RNA helicase DBP10 [Lindgomyces ingoldianus]KAF2472144.1 ATP-dependent RNA helicase DBP10 [Lindgomyces ingoldianus]
MAPRASSPALSENEFDISNALFGCDDVLGKENGLEIDIGINLSPGEEGGSDDEAFIAAHQAASNRKASNLKGKTVKKGGGFQAMGLNTALLKSITRKGFSIPTPIQRKAIPLVLDGQDVVGMARTGSGKTAAFVIPMIEKLKAHSAKVGARGIVLSPSRELALQTLKVVKELGRGADLRTILLVGGDSLEDQFSSMTTNPDIIIATPGRFLHLKVEMGLDLSSVRYIVFDEADRLFEMGFAAQLSEILHALPTTRQTLLFSATLPKSLVEFARAGLQEPKLIRLDAESKISPDLENAFFTVKSADRDGALLHILEKVIKMPVGETEVSQTVKERGQKRDNIKKRKRAPEESRTVDSPTAHSTVIFAATKHRVEYLSSLLRVAGYSVSYVYGNLDQTARKLQVQDFRAGITNILVVTDVAARGIDLPALANVINYDFPSQPKIFVHRVGRTARAGRKGWSYSLIRHSDVAYLIDLQLFLSKKLVFNRGSVETPNFVQDIVVGSLVQDQLEPAAELVTKLVGEDPDLATLQDVAAKGESQYMRTRNSASSESVKRAKQLLASRSLSATHLLFNDDKHDTSLEREKMLAKVSSFRPAETVFEIGKRSSGGEAAEIMRKRRQQIDNKRHKQAKESPPDYPTPDQPIILPDTTEDVDIDTPDNAREIADSESASDSDELEVSFSQPTSRASALGDWENSEYFMSYTPKGANQAEDRAYGVHSGSYNTARQNSNFVEAARGAQMDLTNDEIRGFAEPSKARGMRWDKKSKKYVARVNDEDGSKGVKMVRGESGLKIAASFRSGRFDEWRKSNKIDRLPRTGEMEAVGKPVPRNGGRSFKHRAEKAPKEADRYRDDYHVQKKRVEEAKQNRIGKFKDGGAKNELKGIDDVRKQRKLQERRRDKNARPSKKRKL